MDGERISSSSSDMLVTGSINKQDIEIFSEVIGGTDANIEDEDDSDEVQIVEVIKKPTLPVKEEGKPEEKQKSSDSILISLKDQEGNIFQFRMKVDTKMKKVFEAYAVHVAMEYNDLTFRIDGERVHGDDTPRALRLASGDSIDVYVVQTGGVVVLVSME